MVLVLAGMVGYMYWQQNKILSVVSSLSSFVATQFAPVPEPEDDDDDRVSVVEEVVDKVEVPTTPAATPEAAPEADVDDLQTKTSAELRELLSKKGIPYGKRDSKTALLELLKASA